MGADGQRDDQAFVRGDDAARRGGRLGAATAAFRMTLADPDLRRAQLAFGAMVAA